MNTYRCADCDGFFELGGNCACTVKTVDHDSTKSTSDTGGIRFNKNKVRVSCVPSVLSAAVARVFWASAKENGGKYPMRNWQLGLSWTETAESLLRHTQRLTQDREWLDPESGMPHLWHIATNVAMLLWFAAHNKGTNDLIDTPLTLTDPWTEERRLCDGK